MMSDIINNFGILLIAKLKLDSSFPNSRFKSNGYKIFKSHQNRYGGVFFYM